MSGKEKETKHLLSLIISNKKTIESIDSSQYSLLIDLLDQKLRISNNKSQQKKYQQIRKKIQEQIDLLSQTNEEEQTNKEEESNLMELNNSFEEISQFSNTDNQANLSPFQSIEMNIESKYNPDSIEYAIFEAQKQKLFDERALMAQIEAENECFQSECFHRAQGEGFVPSEQLQELKNLYNIFIDQELFDQATQIKQDIMILEKKEMNQSQIECYNALKKIEKDMYNRQHQQMYNLHYFWNAKILKLKEMKDKKL